MDRATAKQALRRLAERQPRLWRAYTPLRHWYWRLTDDVRFGELFETKQFFSKALHALHYNGISGDYFEFGCFGGTTFSFAYHAARKFGTPRHLWAFDSFRGLPAATSDLDEHPQWPEGALAMGLDEFRRACRNSGVPDAAYDVVPGFYDRTLSDPSVTSRLPTDVALAYIDCDLYSSTKSVLAFLAPRLKHGMILAFDDYYCWTATAASGERLAFSEYLAEDDRFEAVPYQTFGRAGRAFVLEARRH